MRQNEEEQEGESQEDEIKRDDGPVRYWMFFNGDQVRLFSGLAAAFFGVLWCFLYVLGAGKSTASIVLLTLGLLSFWVWRLFDRQIRRYEENGWKKDKHSSRRDRIEIRVAIFLWLFIFVSVGAIMLRQWWHGR